jgi:hypothetical protein
MNFSDFFIKGLRNTLKLRNGANFSFKGQEIRVPNPTIVDQWQSGDFASANYEIVIERGTDHVEHVNLLLTARVNEVSVLSYGRLNLGKDLVKFTATSDNSKVTLTATPYFEEDGVTVLSGIKLTFKATYSERIIPVGIPTITGTSTNLGGEPGVIRNWNNSNLTNGFLEINESGNIIVSAINTVAVQGNLPVVSDFIFSKLNFENVDGAIAITTVPSSNTIRFNLIKISDLVIGNPGNTTSTFVVNPVITGNLNNTSIGNLTNRIATFTELRATGTVNISDGNQQVSMAPTGTGTVSINPSTTGNINNIRIGNVVPKSATVSALGADGHVDMSTLQSITISPTGTGTIVINPTSAGYINNIIFGATVPASAKFTTIELTTKETRGDYLIALSQLKSILLGASA